MVLLNIESESLYVQLSWDEEIILRFTGSYYLGSLVVILLVRGPSSSYFAGSVYYRFTGSYYSRLIIHFILFYKWFFYLTIVWLVSYYLPHSLFNCVLSQAGTWPHHNYFRNYINLTIHTILNLTMHTILNLTIHTIKPRYAHYIKPG